MDQFQRRSIRCTPHNLLYTYYLSPNFASALNKDVPTLLLLHGFPDDAHMWETVVPDLLKLPYPMVIPDLLGFDGTSKPTDPGLYNYKNQVNALNQILDQEKVPNNVIPVGHDWGSAIAQRFYLYTKPRCVGLTILSLAYQVPSPDPFSLDKENEVTAKSFGYPQWEYWRFFTAPDGPNLLRQNIGRFYEINHGNYPSTDPDETGRDVWMREIFCRADGFRDYVTKSGRFKDYTVPLKPYAENPELRKRFEDRLTRDGLEGPVQYYVSLKNNTMLEDERELCKDPAQKRIDVPMLYIAQTGDWVCRTDLMKNAKDQGLTPDLDEKVMQAGHWVAYEDGPGIAKILTEWLNRKFPVKS